MASFVDHDVQAWPAYLAGRELYRATGAIFRVRGQLV